MQHGDDKGMQRLFTGTIEKGGNSCGICCEFVPLESIKSYCNNGHSACEGCWVSHFKAIGPRQLRCIQKCTTFDMKRSMDIMDKIRFEPWITIKNFYDLYYQMDNPDHILCLCQNTLCNTPESVFMIEKGKMWTKCGHCNLAVCNMCQNIIHPNEPCSAPMLERHSIPANANRTIFVNDTRICLCCGARLTKISGCDKVKCSCGYTFCWGCYSPWWPSHMDQIHVKDSFLAVGDPLFVGLTSPLTFLHKDEVIPYYTNIALCLFNLGLKEENKNAVSAVIHLLFNIGGIESYSPFNTEISTLFDHPQNPSLIFISIFYVSVLIKLCYFAFSVSEPLVIDYEEMKKCITISLSKKGSHVLFLKERLELNLKRTESDVIQIIREMTAMQSFPSVGYLVKNIKETSLFQTPKGVPIMDPRYYRIFIETAPTSNRILSILTVIKKNMPSNIVPNLVTTAKPRFFKDKNDEKKIAEKKPEKSKRILEITEVVDVENKHPKVNTISPEFNANKLKTLKNTMMFNDLVERVSMMKDYPERMTALDTVIKEVDELKKYILK